MTLSPINLAELVLVAAAYIPGVIGILQQKQYLQCSPRIATAQDMEFFKDFVRAQMYLTLAFLLCAGPAFILIFFGRAGHSLLATGLLVLPYVPFFVIGRLSKKLEARIKDKARCAPAFVVEFDAICFAWKKQMLPKF